MAALHIHTHPHTHTYTYIHTYIHTYIPYTGIYIYKVCQGNTFLLCSQTWGMETLGNDIFWWSSAETMTIFFHEWQADIGQQ